MANPRVSFQTEDAVYGAPRRTGVFLRIADINTLPIKSMGDEPDAYDIPPILKKLPVADEDALIMAEEEETAS